MGEAAPPVSPVGGVGSVAGSQPGSPRSAAHLLPSEAEDERAFYTETNELADPPDFEPPPVRQVKLRRMITLTMPSRPLRTSVSQLERGQVLG